MTQHTHDKHRDPDEIESDIEQTRLRLDDTLNQLERKFSPQQWMNDTYDYVRHGGANDFVTNLGETVKQNPMPVVLAGVGLGWLILSSSQRNNRHYDRYDDDDDHPALPTTTTPHRAMATPTAGAPAAGTPAAEYQDSKQGRMGTAKNKARHVASGVRGRGTHAKESSRAAMGNLSHRAQGAGSDASHFVQEHPLVAGALGIALGAALGGMLPSTRTEDDYLGETRDKALDKAATAGQRQADKAQAKMEEKGEQAKSSASTDRTRSDPASQTTTSSASASPGQTTSSTTAGATSHTGLPDTPAPTRPVMSPEQPSSTRPGTDSPATHSSGIDNPPTRGG